MSIFKNKTLGLYTVVMMTACLLAGPAFAIETGALNAYAASTINIYALPILNMIGIVLFGLAFFSKKWGALIFSGAYLLFINIYLGLLTFTMELASAQ